MNWPEYRRPVDESDDAYDAAEEYRMMDMTEEQWQQEIAKSRAKCRGLGRRETT
jgi:hypothetical protein